MVWYLGHGSGVSSLPVLPNPKKTSSECPLHGDKTVDRAECVWGQVLDGKRVQKGQEKGKEMGWKKQD